MADAISAQCISAFFSSHGLREKDRLDCDASAQALLPHTKITPAGTQGYCSYTVLAGDRQIVQFRPKKYRLDPIVIKAAERVFCNYAPSTSFMGEIKPSGLLMYTMEKLSGTSYKDYRTIETHLPKSQAWSNHIRLIEDFAIFLARSWHHRAELPPPGKIGSTIKIRLHQLTQELPRRFRPEAISALEQIRRLDALPWALTHGDIVPSNIMMDPTTGRITGLVDWAEAETLPFGLGLYGLEELLGFMTPTAWIYHDKSECLRARFWRKLVAEIPDLRGSFPLMGAIATARNVGVLLWHGFAFDDGAIDRVVEEGRDDEEIRRLDAFLRHGSVHGNSRL
ncbi:hypothetical protein MMC16_003483 [Acarospora aff. strigata]|nr:hypothetical protein [Acarospora aff. strigata]